MHDLLLPRRHLQQELHCGQWGWAHLKPDPGAASLGSENSEGAQYSQTS